MKKLKYIVLSFLMLAVSVSAQETEAPAAIKEDVTVDLAYHKMDKHRFVGAADVVTSDQLSRSTEYQADMIMPGLASGLFVSKGAANPGQTWTTMKVRGLSRGGDEDAPLIVVDGIPDRAIDNIPIESIESITVLKDITAKMLYGSQAANGVILVTTKRGIEGMRDISFSVEAGIKKPTFVAEYLDAAQYAEAYNVSQINDGVDPSAVKYSQDDIDAYRNGTDPLFHPNEDYNSLLKNMTDYQRVNALLRGGDESTKYFLNLEYVREKGLEAVGKGDALNQINLVSNLDYKVNDIISVSADLGTRMGMRSNSSVNGEDLFEAISTHRPNDYPFFATKDGSVNIDSLAYNPIKDKSNIYGDLTRAGYSNTQDFQTQMAMAINLDFDQYVKGLSASVNFGFDSYNTIAKGKKLEYSSYRFAKNDSIAGQLDYTKVGVDEVENIEQSFSDNFLRNAAGAANIKYDNSFGDHDILIDANYSLRRYAYKSVVHKDELKQNNELKQDNKGVNAGIRANYMYGDRYIVELNGSYMGSDRFMAGKRYKPYGAVGAAWVISEENFLKDNDAVSHLKLKASYGTMGYDKSVNYYTYQTQYGGAGGFYSGDNNAKPSWGQRVTQYSNPNLSFEESTELNVGVEAGFFNDKLSLEANYFNELRDGMPILLEASVPSYAAAAETFVNFNAVRNSGVDLNINFADQVGDFYYAVGGNFMYSKAVYEKYEESNLYKHQNCAGTATDAWFGLNALGLYTDADFNADGTTKDGIISSYGDLKPGDIMYKNYTATVNGDLDDKQIDWYDAYENGNTHPRYYYSVNINLAYKGFELYALGQGVADVDKFMGGTYFHNYGERKYSTMVNAADYPRLTAQTNGGNNFLGSTYWKENGSYFKLRNVELSYTVPFQASQRINADQVKIFVRGDDLLTLSSIDTVDPEDVSAGVSKYPLFMTVSLGAKITF